jgi:catechol 2,3-dioxygenase-like lactoylglutathione lyase family enzyme
VHSHPMSFVDANVADLDRSVDFYRGLFDLPAPGISADTGGRRRAELSAGPAVLRLTEVGPDRAVGDWITDDLQKGFRHLGFKVSDLDARAERVRAAGVPFHLEPTDAVGGVRIAFFRDPDGLMLEFIQGTLNYHKVWSEQLRSAERDMPVPGTPRFDHVAVTVQDLDRALRFYRETLGFDVIGQLFHEQDPRGFLITYLRAGDTVLELFTYDAAKSGPSQPGADTLGFSTIGFDTGEVEAIATRLKEAGARSSAAAADYSWQRFLDPDGTPLTMRAAR